MSGRLDPGLYPRVTLSEDAVQGTGPAGPSLLDLMRLRLHETLRDAPFGPQEGTEIGDSLRDLIDAQKHAIAVRVSRDMALDLGLVEPTDAERAERAAEAADRRDAPGPPVTVETLLAHLDWTPEFAAHRLHPECSCSDVDWFVCSWGRDLGFTTDDLSGAS